MKWLAILFFGDKNMERKEYKKHDLVRELKKVQIMLEQNMNKILSKYDLTSSQAPILDYIYRAELDGIEIQQKDIEEYFYLKNPTVTGILDRLEKKGFIIRKISDRDRRMRIVILTNSAKKINNEAIECINIFMKKAYKGVTKEEKDNFINMVNKVSYNLENID